MDLPPETEIILAEETPSGYQNIYRGTVGSTSNDIQLLEGRYFSSAQFGEQLKLEFDQLYAEGAHRKRQMSISTHDRISGTPAQVRVLDDFLTYAKKHPGVLFRRKDEIARETLNDPAALVDNDYR